MTDSDFKSFDKALDHLTATLRVEQLDKAVKKTYWNALKPFSNAQFIACCTHLSLNYRKKHSNDFPLPVDFIEHMPKQYHQHPEPAEEADETNGVRFDVLMPKLLKLMPQDRKRLTDEQAEAMVNKMNVIVDKEFATLKGETNGNQFGS